MTVLRARDHDLVFEQAREGERGEVACASTSFRHENNDVETPSPQTPPFLRTPEAGVTTGERGAEQEGRLSAFRSWTYTIHNVDPLTHLDVCSVPGARAFSRRCG